MVKKQIMIHTIAKNVLKTIHLLINKIYVKFINKNFNKEEQIIPEMKGIKKKIIKITHLNISKVQNNMLKP